VQPAHDELQEEEGGLGNLTVFGEVALDAFLFLASERWVGENDVDAFLFADFGELETERAPGIDLRRVEAVQQEVHLAEQIRQGLRLAAEEGTLL
jgi:hypothetical protein